MTFFESICTMFFGFALWHIVDINENLKAIKQLLKEKNGG